MGCSDTVEESSSDENVFQRKTAHHQRTWTHLQLHTCHSSHVHVKSAHKRCSSVQWYDVTSEFQFNAWRSTGLQNESAHVIQWTISTKLFTLDVTSGEPQQEGFEGVRLGEHERDSAREEPSPRRTRMNEAGDAVHGSQDSITRGVRNLQLADVPAAQPISAARAPAGDAQFPETYPTTASSSRSVFTMYSVPRGPARKHRTYRLRSDGDVAWRNIGRPRGAVAGVCVSCFSCHLSSHVCRVARDLCVFPQG